MEHKDIDFDGDRDVGVSEFGGAKWGYLHWWFYDGGTGRFEWTALSDELYGLKPADWRFDPRLP